MISTQVDCARLELEASGASKANSVLGAALPGGALRDIRARQLLAIFVRSCGSANRGSDVLSVQSAYLCGNQPVRRVHQFFTNSFLGDDAVVLAHVDGVEIDATIQHERAVKFDFHTGAYASSLLRVLKHDAPYPEAWSPSEPLGAQGALWRATRLGDSNLEHREASLRPAPLHGTARDCKARADVADDAYEAIGHLTAALGASPSNASLLAQRAAAYLACDLTNHARSDAARCLALAPAWDGALRCAAQVVHGSQ